MYAKLPLTIIHSHQYSSFIRLLAIWEAKYCESGAKEAERKALEDFFSDILSDFKKLRT